MKISERNIERQVQIWAFMGPFLTMATLFVLLFRNLKEDFLLPGAALAGVLICWRWKLKGLAVSLGVIVSILFYQYPGLPVEDRFWQVGIAMAFALGFVVTALSFEEVEAIVRGIHEESLSRLRHLWQLDEHLKLNQKSRREMEADLRARLENLHTNQEEMLQQLRSYERLITIARQQIIESHREIEELKREGSDLKIHNAKLQEKEEDALQCAEEALKQLKEVSKVKARKSYDDEELVEELMQRIEQLAHQNELLEDTVKALSSQELA